MSNKRTFIQRICVKEGNVSDIFIEEVSREEFDKYKDSLSGGFGGCRGVVQNGAKSFVADFRILGEPSTEICRLLTLSHDSVRDMLSEHRARFTFQFNQIKRKRMPQRSVEVSPSPWDKPDCRNFSAAGIINGKRLWCENGISADAAARIILYASIGD